MSQDSTTAPRGLKEPREVISDALAPASTRRSLRALMELPSAPTAGFWLLCVVVFGGAQAMTTLASVISGRLVDTVRGVPVPVVGAGTRAFGIMVVVVVLLFIVEQSLRSVARYLVFYKSRLLTVDMRRRCLTATLRTPIPQIMELGTGNVITRLTKDLDTFGRTAQSIGMRLVLAVLTFPFSLVALALISPWYGLVFMFVVAVMVPMVRTVLNAMPERTNALSTAEAARNNMLLDTIRGLPTLRALRLKQWALQRMRETGWQTVDTEADRIPLVLQLLRFGSYAYGALVVGNLLLSLWLIDRGSITAGEAAAAMVVVIRLEMAVFNMLFFSGQIQHALTALGRAVALADLHQDARDDSAADLPAAPKVEIRDLGFAYPGGTPIFKNLSLEFAPGTTTALVGTSGAGKSTLASLIAGLLVPTQGKIIVGGVDTADVPNTWVARQVSLISQEVHLFSGTVREDLRMAAPEATDAHLLEVLATVGLAEDSAAFSRALPQGLDTLIGAGHQLTAPEVAQQISLARTLLRNPPILIMDEATSEAGSQSAEALEAAAQAATVGRTCLVVAHRLDQARVADRILVMENGEIVEDGTHEQLLALGGRYHDLYQRWEA